MEYTWSVVNNTLFVYDGQGVLIESVPGIGSDDERLGAVLDDIVFAHC